MLSEAVHSFRASRQKAFPIVYIREELGFPAGGSLSAIPTIHRALDHLNLGIATILSPCILIIAEIDW